MGKLDRPRSLGVCDFPKGLVGAAKGSDERRVTSDQKDSPKSGVRGPGSEKQWLVDSG